MRFCSRWHSKATIRRDRAQGQDAALWRALTLQACFKFRGLRAFVPGGEVLFLVGRELVDLEAHRFELELGDLLVEVLGNRIDLRLEVLRVLDHVFGGESLI